MKEYLKPEYIPFFGLGLMFIFGTLGKTPETLISALVVLGQGLIEVFKLVLKGMKGV